MGTICLHNVPIENSKVLSLPFCLRLWLEALSKLEQMEERPLSRDLLLMPFSKGKLHYYCHSKVCDES
jgi:hypothetical protein